jgi:predicted dehydrogenase
VRDDTWREMPGMRLMGQDVNIVYVGTMNIAHFDDAKLALEAGKHCLLEKVCGATPSRVLH